MQDIFTQLISPSVFPWMGFILGLCVGSFLNVVIHRLPRMMENDWRRQCAEINQSPPPAIEPLSLAKPRSRCPSCGHGITAAENIPVLSWALLKGRCSACKAPIGLRYPVVELVAAVSGAFCAWRFGPGLAGWGAMAFVWIIIAASVIDIDTQLLPDAMTQIGRAHV